MLSDCDLACPPRAPCPGRFHRRGSEYITGGILRAILLSGWACPPHPPSRMEEKETKGDNNRGIQCVQIVQTRPCGTTRGIYALGQQNTLIPVCLLVFIGPTCGVVSQCSLHGPDPFLSSRVNPSFCLILFHYIYVT